MGSQIDQYANQIEHNVAEYVATISTCSDEEWGSRCLDEERTVAVVAHHMAMVQDGLARLLDGIKTGTPVPVPDSGEAVDQMNAEHARTHAGVTRQETIDLLQSSGRAYVNQLRSLVDADLERSAGVVAGNELTIGQVTQYAIIGHQQQHLESIRGALAQ